MNGLPNKRCSKIITVLLNTDKPITTKKLSAELNVSSRTIRSDLKKLKNWFEKKNIELIKKPGVGVWIEADNFEKVEVENYLHETKNYTEPLSPENRQLYILKALLQTGNKNTMLSLANELFVSRTTIYKDLKEVEKWLAKYSLKIEKKQNCGIYVEGKEKNWREAVADLLIQLKNNEKLKKILKESSEILPGSRIDRKTYRQLNSIFKGINFKEIEDIIEKALEESEKELDFLFTNEAFVGLVIHIAISIERLKKDKDIKMESEQLKKLRDKKEYRVAELISNKLEENLNVKIPEAEIGYISLHILGSKLKKNINTTNLSNLLRNSDPEIIRIANEIITTVEKILNVDFKDDEKLVVGLVIHLRTAINRLKYGMSLRNPLLGEIKNNYPSVFGAAWATSMVFEKYLDLKVTEEEIGYIALHLCAALERIKNKIKAVVVCSSGIGTSQFVGTKLNKRLLDIEIVDLISAYEAKNSDLSNVDLLITTIPLESENIDSKKIIQISPLVTDNDINLINEKFNIIRKRRKTNKGNSNLSFFQILNEDLIFVNLKINDKKEVIEYLSKKLYQKGFVDEQFVHTVLEREHLTSTNIGNGVAIPHGYKENIIKSTFVIATLDDYVDWGNGEVDTVFLLVFEEKKTAQIFFQCFQRILEDNELLNNIKNAENKQEIKNIILENNIKTN